MEIINIHEGDQPPLSVIQSVILSTSFGGPPVVWRLIEKVTIDEDKQPTVEFKSGVEINIVEKE